MTRRKILLFPLSRMHAQLFAILVIGLIAGLFMPALAYAQSPTPIDVTGNDDQVFANGMRVVQFSPTTSSGSGNYQSFVRLQDSPEEEGYNTDGRPYASDGNDAGNTGQFNRAITLAEIPRVVINGEIYFEFGLDANEANSGVNAQFSLDELRVYTDTTATLLGYNPSTLQLGGRTALYDMDIDTGGNPADISFLLSEEFSSGSGGADYLIYVPAGPFLAYPDNTYIYLYSKLGAYSTNFQTASTFEEWNLPGSGDGARLQIDLEKLVSVDGGSTWVDADAATGPSTTVGSDVYFRFEIENTGIVNLTNITLTDSDFSALITNSCTLPTTLAPTDAPYVCEIGPVPAIAGQHQNTATAGGTYDTLVISDEDLAHYFGESATVVIQKVSIGDTGTFGFTSSPSLGAGSFSLTTTSPNVITQTTFSGLIPGQFIVTEDDPTTNGWDLTVLSCNETGVDNSTTNLSTRAATINVEAGETVTCTFTNMRRGSLAVTKQLDWSGVTPFSGSQFDICIQGPSYPTTPDCRTFEPVDNGGAWTDSQTWQDLQTGTYTVTEPSVADGWQLVTISSESVVVAAGGTAGPVNVINKRLLGALDIQKTATTVFTSTYSWDIEKTVTPDVLNLFEGQSQTVTYTVDVTQTGSVDSDHRVSGSVSISNTSTIFSEISDIEDYLDGYGPITLDCGVSFPYQLAGGQELVCTYSEPLPSALSATNTVTVTLSNGEIYTGNTAVNFGTTPNTQINNPIDVTDTNGDSWQFSATGSQQYQQDLSCADIPTFSGSVGIGDYINEVEITQTGQTDDAVVAISCYRPSVSKTANPSIVEEYDWAIEKSASPTTLDLFEDGSATVNYTIDLTRTLLSTVQNLDGSITIQNPNPASSLTIETPVDTIDLLGQQVSVTCNSGLVVPAAQNGTPGVLTCGYGTTLSVANNDTFSNTAVITTSYGLSYTSGQVPFTFSGVTPQTINASVTVTDTNPASGQPWSFNDSGSQQYSLPVSCQALFGSGDYVNGVASTTLPNTAQIFDENQNPGASDDASVDVTCTQYSSLTIVKQALGPDGTFWFSSSPSLSNGSFFLTTNGGVDSTTFNNLTSGAYTVTETSLPTGWELTDITCSSGAQYLGNPATGELSLSLAAGSNITCTFTNEAPPVIDVTKTANPTSVPEGADATVTFSVRVDNDSNSGDPVTLDALTDDVYGDLLDASNPALSNNTCAALAGTTIQPSGFVACSFDATVPAGNVGDVATDRIDATASDNEGNDATAFDTADVIYTDVLPVIAVEKVADPTVVVEPGGDVTFTVTVTNQSPEIVSLFALTDTIYGDLNGQGTCALSQTLAANGGTYTCAFIGAVTGVAGDIHNNVVTATAADDEQNETIANDDATVTIGDGLPTISVLKIADPISVPEPGTDVTFSVTVTNTSPEIVTLITLTDTIYGDLNGQGTCALTQSLAANGGTYTCQFTGAVTGNAGDVHNNIVTAGAVDRDSNPATATDDATVTISNINPAIAIIKDGDAQINEGGDTATFTFRITNNSNTSDPVTVTSLTDDKFGDLLPEAEAANGGPIVLSPGASFNFSIDRPLTLNAGDSHTNVVTVTAEDDEGTEATDNDDHVVTAQNLDPTIAIVKDGDAQINEGGDTATFTFRITNNSNTGDPVTVTSLTDDKFGDLLPEAEAANGGPIVLNPGASFNFSIDRPLTLNAGDSHTNVVTVTAEDDEGTEATDNDDHVVTAQNLDPAIAIIKDGDAQINEGSDTVTFTFRITNNSNTSDPLTVTSLTDDKFGDLLPEAEAANGGPIVLSPGASFNFSIDRPLTLKAGDSHTNVVTVIAEDDEGTEATDNDDHVVTAQNLDPTITVEKTPSTANVVAPGGPVTFTVVIENNSVSTDPVTIDSLVDDIYGDLTAADNTTCALPQVIQPGSSYTCAFTGQVTGADGDTHTNIVTASGADDDGTPVTAEDDAVVGILGSGLAITKLPATQTVLTGTTAAFTITVTNVGETALSNVVVADPQCTTGPTYTGGDADNNNLLDLREVWTYTCLVANVTSDFTNIASVTATDPTGATVGPQEAQADVVVVAPDIDVTKQLVRTGAAADGVVVIGEPLSYTIRITNTGNIPLDTVVFTDTYDATYLQFESATPAPSTSDAGTLVWSDVTGAGTLDPGASTEITVRFTALASTTGLADPNLPNTAAVEGQSNLLVDCLSGARAAADKCPVPAVFDQDLDVVAITDPSVAIAKTVTDPADGRVAVGELVTFTIVISNTGDTTLVTVEVRDIYPSDELDYVRSSLTTPPATTPTGTLTWADITDELGDIAPGAAVSFTVTFRFIAEASTAATNVAELGIVLDENADQLEPPTGQAGATIIGSPTAVVLSRFVANLVDGGVRVEWTTANEFNTWGFRLLRSQNNDRSQAVFVGDAILPATGADSNYQILDPDGTSTSYYWLQEQELDGTLLEYGPIRVTGASFDPNQGHTLYLPNITLSDQ